MQPLPVRVDQGAMAIKGYSAFPKASPSDFFSIISGHSLVGSYPSAVKQSVYSAVPADWSRTELN